MMITFELASKIILENIKLMPSEFVNLIDASGRYTTEDMISTETSPPFDNSAMDGYAARYEDIKDASADNPKKLKLVGEVSAGLSPETSINPNETMQIFTGAPIPKEADVVIPVESTKLDGNYVVIFESSKQGKFIRKRGGDINVGDLVLIKGSLIRAQEQALLGSIGITEIKVHRQPKVAILSTGNELVDVSEKVSGGMIRDVNGLLLSSLVSNLGLKPVLLDRVKDDPEEIEKAILTGLQYDFLITSGGVSVGDYDYVKGMLKKVGVKILFNEIKIKPGKPVVFGLTNNSLIFGLPGNPVSCFVSFHFFIEPALKKAMGANDFIFKSLKAKLANNHKNNSGRDSFARGILYLDKDYSFHITVFDKQESNILETVCKANAFARIPYNKHTIDIGEKVEVFLFDKILLK
jgi:molybdopterin molybdotransferase